MYIKILIKSKPLMQGLRLAAVVYSLLTVVYCTDVEEEGGGRIYLTDRNFQNAEKIPLVGFPESEPDPIEETENITGHVNPDARTVARRKRNVQKNSKWPNGIVPYQIVGKFDPDQLDIIAKAISEFHKYTCVKWVPYDKQKHFVTIFSPKRFNCWADVGRLRREQKIALGFKRGSKRMADSCVRPGFVIHEMMHTIGFHHEQSRPDRDEHVEIVWKNIAKINHDQFQIEKNVATLGLPYDYASVMHYSKFTGSKNGKPTIKPKHNTKVVMGKKKGFSVLDIKKINKLYGCKPSSKRRRTLSTISNGPCLDNSSSCRVWAKKEYCRSSKFKKYMAKNCRKSCKECNNSGR